MSRRRYAGTYDQRWNDEFFPLLPMILMSAISSVHQKINRLIILLVEKKHFAQPDAEP
jgi:hypothetical protein